jgi:chromosome segregation ATPase
LRNELTQVRFKLESKQNSVNRLGGELQELKTSYADVVRDAAAAKARSDASVRVANEQSFSAATAQAIAEEQCRNAVTADSACRLTVDNLKQEIQSLKTTSAKLPGVGAQLQDALIEVESRQDQLDSRIKAMGDIKINLQSEHIAAREAESKGFEAALQVNKDALESLQRQVDSLQLLVSEGYARQKQAVMSEKSRIEGEYERRLEQAQTAYTDKCTELAAKEKALHDESHELAKTREQSRLEHEQYEQLEQTEKSTADSLEQAQTKVQKLDGDLKAAETQCGHLTDKLKQEKQARSADNSRFDEELKRAQEHIEAAKSAIGTFNGRHISCVWKEDFQRLKSSHSSCPTTEAYQQALNDVAFAQTSV